MIGNGWCTGCGRSWGCWGCWHDNMNVRTVNTAIWHVTCEAFIWFECGRSRGLPNVPHPLSANRHHLAFGPYPLHSILKSTMLAIVTATLDNCCFSRFVCINTRFFSLAKFHSGTASFLVGLMGHLTKENFLWWTLWGLTLTWRTSRYLRVLGAHFSHCSPSACISWIWCLSLSSHDLH